MSQNVHGLETILKRMDVLKNTGKVAVLRAAIRGGLNVIGKQMKKDLDPKAKKGKLGVKSRFKKGSRKIAAKVGFGIGKKKDAKPVVRKKRSGVGISRNNIHWWVAGTKTRTTKSGSDRGKMPSMQPGLARIAYSKSKGQINAEMIKRGALQLTKEINKLQKVK